jgi:hypothetical protein
VNRRQGCITGVIAGLLPQNQPEVHFFSVTEFEMLEHTYKKMANRTSMLCQSKSQGIVRLFECEKNAALENKGTNFIQR